MVPDLDKESANVGHVSTLNVVRERRQGHLDLLKTPQHSTVAPSRPDFSRLGSHVLAGIDSETVGTSTRHTRGREGPWLADLSRQYTPPQHSSAHSTPRISSYSLLPRIRASSFTDHSQRPFDEWAISQKSYPTPLLLPSPGHPHAATDPDNSQEYTYVKHEPDADLTMPPPRLGWAYINHQAPPVPAWEAGAVRGSQYNASAVRDDPGSSLLNHLHQPARDPTAPSPHGTGGVAEHDSAV
ncbi:hypothetical protein DFH94DRAFT_381453 [Russula ochroleuca]|uniref:Uncharacterized protein n=1 Tax=Russula ochroleuca TaxID=152965 RepID=A0A9P5TAX9_9AGAM|nr:hypothetical protein DFH94DRAFT_381453 [Russula ochroleuca]